MTRDAEEIAALAASHIARLAGPPREPFVTCSKCGRWYEVDGDPVPDNYKQYDAYPACCGVNRGRVVIRREARP